MLVVTVKVHAGCSQVTARMGSGPFRDNVEHQQWTRPGHARARLTRTSFGLMQRQPGARYKDVFTPCNISHAGQPGLRRCCRVAELPAANRFFHTPNASSASRPGVLMITMYCSIAVALAWSAVAASGTDSRLPGQANNSQAHVPGSAPASNAAAIFDTGAPPRPETQIDRIVLDQLQRMGLEPASLCSDAVFIRRVYLDAIGTLPTADEVKQFLLDKRPDKRRLLIDRLLERDEFADYWAMKWCDLLRVKAEFPINLWPNAAQAYHRWVRSALRQNMPYDRFARELLTASGSNFRVPQVNFYRAMQDRGPEGVARAVALTFMGVRAEKWPANTLKGMAAFFSQLGYKTTGEWKEEIVYWNPAATNAQPAGVLPDGTRVEFNDGRDPRELFSDWLVSAQNPWFTRNIVNRIWSWLFGRGIVHEPDDIRPDNPPVNPALLVYLEHELIGANYDLKHIYRLILNSHIYQLSSLSRTNTVGAGANFAFYPVRRLDAEVIIDALNQLTGATDQYISPVPEPFTVLPAAVRAIALPDASITSPTLELFGRSPRDTGVESERNNRLTAAQRLYLLNSSVVQRKLEQSRLIRSLSSADVPLPDAVTTLYLTILSRYPTETELRTVQAYAESGATRAETILDVAWALINSAEFMYRH